MTSSSLPAEVKGILVNLRGVNDAGKPLADRFNGQSNALMRALNIKGAGDAPTPIG